jgi:hypothetical protein
VRTRTAGLGYASGRKQTGHGAPVSTVKPEIRTLTRSEVGTVVAWAAQEGWNPGLCDGDAFFAADHEGFLGAFFDGELAGAVSAVRYGADLGFIGLFIVQPAYRKYLFGVRLGRAALDLLDGRRIGTDGVPAQQHQYERLGGFETAWRTVRYRGILKPARPPGQAGRDRVLMPAASVAFDDLAAYDAAHFGARRDGFLLQWIGLPGHRSLVCLDEPVAGRDPAIRGFAVMRACREGAKIGPLFAEDAGTAEALFRRLTRDGGDVTIDTPEANLAAVALAKDHGMTPVFETARMYRGGDPGLTAERIFGITSLELG